MQHLEVILIYAEKLVEQYRAQITIWDNDHNTPIMLAEKTQHFEIATYLIQQLPQPKSCCVL